MAMEVVSNYKCDRCGRSEIRDGVKILTLTIRERQATRGGGQGKAVVTKHICQENCLKIVNASMRPVGLPGHYDRTAAAQRRKAALSAVPDTDTTPETPKTKTSTTKSAKGGTKGGTKLQTPHRRPLTAVQEELPTDTRADVVRAVRAITRTPNGGWAKGHNNYTERNMIAERERLSEKDL